MTPEWGESAVSEEISPYVTSNIYVNDDTDDADCVGAEECAQSQC